MTLTQSTIEQRIDRLESLHEIRQLPYRYAYGVDARDLDAFMALWDDSLAPTEYPDLDYHKFADGTGRFFKTSVASVHFIGNHLIEFADADHATGKVYAWVHTDRHGTWVRQMILYLDDYVRKDGRWLFAKRRHLLWWGEKADVNPRHQEPMDWPHGDLQGNGSFGRGSLPEDFDTYRAFWAANGG
jgi:hypothetical protein